MEENKFKRKASREDRQIGKNVKALREERRKTAKDLGGVLGITFQQIQKYESGANRISGGSLYLLAEYLEVPIVVLFKGLGEELPTYSDNPLSSTHRRNCGRVMEITCPEKQKLITLFLNTLKKAN